MKLRLAIVLSCAAFLFRAFGPLRESSEAAGVWAETGVEPQRGRRVRPRGRRRTPASARKDYGKFSHRTEAHQRDCSSCHLVPTPNWRDVRERGAAFPDVTDYPDHPSCVNCHRQQFFQGARPQICSICHVNVSPRDGRRLPFSNPSENLATKKLGEGPTSQFGTIFPHDKHQDVMAFYRLRIPEELDVRFVPASLQTRPTERKVDSCSVCHQTYDPVDDPKNPYVLPTPEPLPENELRIKAFWLKEGTFKTTPTSHAACFNCHWKEGGERPLASDCAGCHKLLAPGESLRVRSAKVDAELDHPSARTLTDPEIRESWAERKAATFRHEWRDHANVGCTSCHVNITAASVLDEKTRHVPIQTCSSSKCHGSTRPPKGTLFQEVELRRKPDGAGYKCIECHQNLGREPIPPSHDNLFPRK